MGFDGRAGRPEYWYFFLFNIIIAIVLSVVDNVAGTFNENTGMGLLSGFYSLAVLLPSLSVMVLRLHDTDRTGWWALILLIPFIGVLVMLVFMTLAGSPDDNRFAPIPRNTPV